VGRRSNWKVGWFVLAAVALVATWSGAATIANRARLREGPSKDTKLLGWVEEGTNVAIEGERNGWYAVRTPDGQTGYVWQEHLRFDGGEGPAGAVAATIATPTSLPGAAPVAIPSAAVAPAIEPRSTGERSDATVAAELERLRGEISRLATAQQDLAQRVGRGSAVPVPISSDGSAAAGVIFFLAGAFVGFIIGRFAVGRRDRRTRIRL
jgi:hypothetical protein